ncbi:interleukin-1 receptor-associated kinase 1-binding protein 1 [Echinops telfairi]|uniref:Interleukin-1 receptor-associated kinase 1-binding protein 1 n=1 Tax=Echinops telfairi TaxID=9371 RepID=A0AC55DEU2_ECHTE|nr:interleukin-1 receptor-associated kinase 1-binding protein 1 [Echinops telfairi]
MTRPQPMPQPHPPPPSNSGPAPPIPASSARAQRPPSARSCHGNNAANAAAAMAQQQPPASRVFVELAENVTVTKDFRRVENAYHMEAEVCITFTEFGKMQTICNFLVEKLDSSVVISPPQFYHTPGSVETLRRKACLVAVENARRKAQEVCTLVGQSIGKPLLIKEEETKEWEGQIDDHQSSRLSSSLTVQQKIKSATIHAASKVFVTFEVKGKEKKKRHL